MARTRFLAQLIHTCTIQRSTEGSADAHGQPALTWANLATSVACLYMPRAHAMMPGKEVRDRRQDVLLADDVVFMAYRDVAEKDRISNIQNSAGTVLEAGPLNIRLVKNAAGQSHHVEVHVQHVEG